MRNILFRGKRMDNREWVEGGSIIHFDPENDQELVFMPHMHEGCTSTHDNDDNITAFESGMFYKVDPASVGQYTGLKDKNEKKIFEGDIVRYAIYPPDQFVHGVVNYKDGAFRIGDQGCALCVCAADGIEEYRLEVIGNIHDNPELIGGTENVSHP